MAPKPRQYECIVLGATGYTGKYTCEHITTHLPTNFNWAVSGRNEAKLHSLVDELWGINSNRTPPETLPCSLRKSDLVALAQKTKVLITTIGPYHKYGTPVVEACAETGTHYLDVTGEIPWTYDMVKQHHETAKQNGAIMIPQDGMESVPADLLCWSLASHIREKIGVGTKEAVLTVWELNSMPSGGTLATVMSIFDSYTPAQFKTSSNPWSLSLIPQPKDIRRRSWIERMFNVRSVAGLGSLTYSPQNGPDLPIIHRSWSLYDNGKFYGPNFHASIYAKAKNKLTALTTSIFLKVVLAALALAPIRWLLKRFIYQPGQGPTREQASKEHSEWRAIAYADVSDPNNPKRAFARMRWNGSMYHLTGVCLAEAALILAREKTFANELGGGMLTPATLGGKYVEALRKAGLEIEVRMML